MNSTLRLAGGILLVLALLVGLGAITVSAQGPTGTATPTQTPAQAPNAAAAGTFRDDPAAANTLGSTVGAIPAGGAAWFKFNYDTNGNAFPRPTVMIRMLNGVQNGLNFEVWSPERMVGNWFDNIPVGRGTQEVIPDCTVTLPDNTTVKCTSNDLTWVGGFGAPGTYFVRVTNGTNNSVAPSIIVSGPGIAECQSGANLPNNNPTAAGFTTEQCETPTLDQLNALSQAVAGNQGAGNAPAVAPGAAATSTPAAPAATATTAAPAATSTTAATSAAPAATSTPAAAPSVAATDTPSSSTGGAALPPCTPAPTSAAGTDTPTSTASSASGTATPSPTPNCVMPAPGSSSGGTSSTPAATSPSGGATPAGTATP